MKRRTNTLDAEYKRRGLIRPAAVAVVLGISTNHVTPADAEFLGHTVERFDWKGTSVWGVTA